LLKLQNKRGETVKFRSSEIEGFYSNFTYCDKISFVDITALMCQPRLSLYKTRSIWHCSSIVWRRCLIIALVVLMWRIMDGNLWTTALVIMGRLIGHSVILSLLIHR